MRALQVGIAVALLNGPCFIRHLRPRFGYNRAGAGSAYSLDAAAEILRRIESLLKATAIV